ncbi:hypothetical protein [Leptospira noguchii]|uniref:hypothetical protein n=2 Tax=Leptospira noguchii TaxID=28182 RepID=UPI001FB80FC2|nr:hypothetical protein [Leptospira noguchii]UOG52481.1 hypothetical protein MAL09_18245 [Leptospira noguchii]
MLRSIVSSIEFEKFRRNWSEKNSAQRFLRKRLKLNTTLTTDRVVGREPVHYEICELRRRPIGSRCIEFIIRPNFLTSNSRFLKDSLIPK